MKYKIVVDKQSRTNPSEEKREYEVDIEELRCKENVYDSLVITKDEDYVMRRLELTDFYVLKELETPIKEPLENINIELFEGDNYIYLIDMVGNKFYAEYLIKNDFSESYTLKSEFKTAMNQTSQKFEIMASTKLDKNEFATYLEVNSEAVKIAWNKIAEYIQMMIINENASLAILDKNKKVMMALDKTGQHFYKDDGTTVFGEMGVNKEEDNTYISFSVNGDYNTDIENGMAWGIKTTSDNKYYPILYIKNFHMGKKNTDDVYGQLSLAFCDLVLDGMEKGIISGNVKMFGNVFSGLSFYDTNSESDLLNIFPINSGIGGVEGGGLSILNNIQMFKNSLGSNSFKIGNILMTDAGYLSIESGDVMIGTSSKKTDFTVYVPSLASIHGNLDVDGNVYANNISSDRRIKENIVDCTESAIDIIKKIQHKEFDKKDDGKHYKIGYIAQDMEQIDENFVIKKPADEKRNIEERYYINELPIIATLTKAIQEQQEQIEQLKKNDEQKDNLIKTLIERIEKLEAKNEKESI